MGRKNFHSPVAAASSDTVFTAASTVVAVHNYRNSVGLANRHLPLAWQIGKTTQVRLLEFVRIKRFHGFPLSEIVWRGAII